MSAITRAYVVSGRRAFHQRRLTVICPVLCCLIASLLSVIKVEVALLFQQPSSRIARRLIVQNSIPGNKEFTKQEVSRFRTLFAEFDKDGDGEITKSEIRCLFAKLGALPKDGELQEMIKDYCKDDTGVLDFDSFCTMMLRKVMDADNEHYDEVGSIIRDFVRKVDQNIDRSEDHSNEIQSKKRQGCQGKRRDYAALPFGILQI